MLAAVKQEQACKHQTACHAGVAAISYESKSPAHGLCANQQGNKQENPSCTAQEQGASFGEFFVEQIHLMAVHGQGQAQEAEQAGQENQAMRQQVYLGGVHGSCPCLSGVSGWLGVLGFARGAALFEAVLAAALFLALWRVTRRAI